MPAPIRVLVVDDSALTRRVVGRVLRSDVRVAIVGFAVDGSEAIERAVELRPDVITLDQMMPGMTGLEALPELVRRTDARVVMLSAVDDPDTAYAALDLGAVEFVVKPREGLFGDMDEFASCLTRAIDTAYRIGPAGGAAAARAAVAAARGAAARATGPSGDAETAAPISSGTGSSPGAVVALGASTGGPPALEAVFSGLSIADDSAYFVVQHLPAGFSESLARRLDRIADLHVVVAKDGMTIRAGTAYVAPHGVHMTVSRRPQPLVRLKQGSLRHGVMPAADTLFESVARAYGRRSIGAVLTGMGTDGAEGLAALRAAGAHTVAQDEESSTVWGMPGAAVRSGAAVSVLPLGAIAGEIRRAIGEVMRA